MKWKYWRPLLWVVTKVMLPTTGKLPVAMIDEDTMKVTKVFIGRGATFIKK